MPGAGERTESEQISGCQGLRVGGNGEGLLNAYVVSSWGDENVLEIQWQRLLNIVNVLKATKLYTLKWLG